MYRTTYNCKEYKNGNITIKYDTDTIEASKKDPVFTLSECLYWIDCYFIGDTFCLSNFETGHTIYNTHSDYIYIFPWSFIEKLEAGQTVRLYARRPSTEEREEIEEGGLL